MGGGEGNALLPGLSNLQLTLECSKHLLKRLSDFAHVVFRLQEVKRGVDHPCSLKIKENAWNNKVSLHALWRRGGDKIKQVTNVVAPELNFSIHLCNFTVFQVFGGLRIIVLKPLTDTGDNIVIRRRHLSASGAASRCAAIRDAATE